MLSESPRVDILVDQHPHQSIESPEPSRRGSKESGEGGLTKKFAEEERRRRKLREQDEDKDTSTSSFGIEENQPGRRHSLNEVEDTQRLRRNSLLTETGRTKVCVDAFDWWGLSSKSAWTKVGKGGYGTVYKAKWYGTTVAVKEANREKRNARKGLMKEYEYLLNSTHPNVVRVYGCYENNGFLYVVMEYLPYTLREEWVASRVDILSVTIQVARAMLFLHRKGIVHRDIKTRNICLTSDYRTAKLIDFGLAASVYSTPEELMRKVGTRKYRAPEVNHPSVQGFGVDIYSYGAMLRRLINDITENLIQCANEDPLKTVLTPLAAMCMHQNPCVRPTALEILQYLHQCVHSLMPVKEMFATTMNEDLKEYCLDLNTDYNPLGRLVHNNEDSVEENAAAVETGTEKEETSQATPAGESLMTVSKYLEE